MPEPPTAATATILKNSGDSLRIFNGLTLNNTATLEGNVAWYFVRPGEHADPYRVLGVPRETAMPDVKAAHRKLVRENHPDTLIAQGMPEEMITVANAKLAAINAAYDRIRAERGGA